MKSTTITRFLVLQKYCNIDTKFSWKLVWSNLCWRNSSIFFENATVAVVLRRQAGTGEVLPLHAAGRRTERAGTRRRTDRQSPQTWPAASRRRTDGRVWSGEGGSRAEAEGDKSRTRKSRRNARHQSVSSSSSSECCCTWGHNDVIPSTVVTAAMFEVYYTATV